MGPGQVTAFRRLGALSFSIPKEHSPLMNAQQTEGNCKKGKGCLVRQKKDRACSRQSKAWHLADCVMDTVRRIETVRGHPDRSIELMRDAVPYDLGNLSDNGFACLLPVYVRAQAYLSARQGLLAVAEFHKILGHRGLLWNCPTYPLAHLGLARSYALFGDKEKSSSAYQEFLTLWKDADPDIPILKQAKAERAKLQ